MKRSHYGYIINNIHEKITVLNSDWLRAVQFKCKTSAKSVTPTGANYIKLVLLDYDLPERQKEIF